ncbi:hypothetical protein AAFF_G00371180 [Aldrovandia affinis]|uniref:GAS2-like protein 2 n=1 Tax=Aldrovandia affinis TaxID=143900 RepID=A0AAD7WMJ8_9TELE|nr:hypothetical protein AAFF_G00371180 [Aldrovandia affinis]
MSGIEQATNRSIKPFKSSEEYLYAMKEDLAEWLKDLYDIDIAATNFLEILETGSVLCYHANNVTRVAGDFLQEYGKQARRIKMPTAGVTFISSAQATTFLARDNISNFINWCRNQMDIKDVLMFETDDLVLRKNEKNFVLCLLEVARRASRFGMTAPVLIQLEQEIEEEIREELDLPQEETPLPKPQRRMSDFKNLDQMVQHLVSSCTCPSQFPMVKVSEGKYRVGDSSTLIFVRILRNHVMVRVGGGWDTLEHYLDKHDPCRCSSLAHKPSKQAGPQRPATPVHEIKTRLMPRPDGQGKSPATLLLGRTQSPLPPVHWTPSTPSTPSRGLKPGGASTPPPRSSSTPGPGSRTALELCPPTPGRHRERSTTPTRRQPPSESKEDLPHSASTRPGREMTRASPSPRLASSLPRPIQPSPALQPETQRPKTPLVFQRTSNQLTLGPQPALAQTWTKSQFSSKLRQGTTPSMKNTEAQNRGPSLGNTQGQGGLGSTRPAVPARCRSPIKNLHLGPKHVPVTIQQAEYDRSPSEGLDLIRSFSPAKQVRDEAWGELQVSPLTAISRDQRGSEPVEQTVQKKSTTDSAQADPPNRVSNGDATQMGKQSVRLSRRDTSRFPISQGDPFCGNTIYIGNMEPKDPVAKPNNKDRGEDARNLERGCLFTPPPISPAQEASLYRSLEQEILSNLQLLSMESDDNDSSESARETGSLDTVQKRREHPSGCSSIISMSKASPPSLVHAAQGMSVSDSSGPDRVSHNAGAAELSAGKRSVSRADVESWMATLPKNSRNTLPQTSSSEAGSGHLGISKPSVTGSWSSLGSSMESKEATDLGRHLDTGHEVDAGATRPSVTITPESSSTTASSAGSIAESPAKPRTPSFKQKRVLKKPERVPSIYKLKLRTRVRPRRDHRPEKKPSKIPTPLSYRRGQPSRNSLRAKRQAADRASSSEVEAWPSQHGSNSRARFAGKKPSVEEMLGDPEQESWV